MRLRYAGFWIRFLAGIIDGIIIGIPASILQMIVGLITENPDMSQLVSFAVLILVVYLDGTKGGTPGKLILGLKIVNEQGKCIGVINAALRYLGKIVSTIILGIGFLMVIWDKKKQGLHDRIADTYVVWK
ncbi:MAG: RDD family protein [Nanoarchaeota archaeon]|nr:RDD family protein [Nanoarchaeota archaeon]